MKYSATLILVIMLFSVPAMAEVQTRQVEYTAGETVMKGFLAYDDAVEGQRPGILVVHE